jgi:hypothetical protein
MRTEALKYPAASAGMGTNIAGAWQEVAKLLQDYSTKQPGSADANAALDQVQHLVAKLDQLPSPPKAIWKKLVQQIKVRRAQPCHISKGHVPRHLSSAHARIR